MQKSIILAVAALVSVALADPSSGNIISRRLNMGSESETKRNVQAISTSYTSAQYCPSTKTYYYSKAFYCAPSVTGTINSISNAVTSATTYSTAQYCSYTKSYYYSKAYVCSAAIGNALNAANNALNYLSVYAGVSTAKNALGAIIGGVVGGIVFIIILICVCCYCCCKKAADATKQVASAVSTPQINVTQQPIMQPMQPMMMQPQPMMMQQPAPIIIKV
jgi:hypothetical protein